MRATTHVVLRAGARFYAPLMALFALALLALRGAGQGVGLLAGLAFALVFALHVIVAGAAAAQTAFSPMLARLLTSLGLIAAASGAGAPAFAYAPQMIEAGLFVAVAAGSSLLLCAIAGRAPTLRDEEW